MKGVRSTLPVGNHLARIGHCSDAGAELCAAAELYRAMDMAFWLLQADMALAEAGSSGTSRVTP